MKKYWLRILSLICIFPLITAQATTNASNQMIAQTVMAWMKTNDIPGVAVEVYNNGVPHSYYFGYADRQTKKLITGATIFEIGSLTQLFTSLLLAEEVDTNKVKLSDPMVNYLIDLNVKPNKQLNKITLQNLATHTAGLPFNLPKTVRTQSDLDFYFPTWKPQFPIGSQWAYSNVGVGLLGSALEVITHESFNQLYRGKILQPLGMQPIGIVVPKQLLSNYVQGYDDNGAAVLRKNIDDLFPSSDDMKVSAVDMLQFLKAAIGLPGVPVTIARAMQITQTSYVSTPNMQQGLGWNIYSAVEKHKAELLNPPATMDMRPMPAQQLTKDQQKFDGAALMDATGATAGFRVYIALIPNAKSGVVILVNRNIPDYEIIRLGREILFN
jgi:beta-lactamase class C